MYFVKKTVMEKRDNFRDIIYDRLCQDLIGPMDVEEIIDDNPIDQYVLGSLSPTNNKITQEEDDDKIEVANDSGSVDTSDNFTQERVTSSKTTRPSTIGVSFEIEKTENTNPSIRIAISAAIYEPTWIDENNKIITEQINQQKKFQKWKRKPLSLVFDHSISLGTESIDLKSKGLEGLNIHVKRLDLESRCTVTVSLINNQLTEKNSSKQDNAIKTFFQTSLQIEKINSTERIKLCPGVILSFKAPAHSDQWQTGTIKEIMYESQTIVFDHTFLTLKEISKIKITPDSDLVNL